MGPTLAQDHDAPHCAAGRDLVAKFVDGCRVEGILPFFYHATLDGYQPSFPSDVDAYLDYLHKSLEVLCTHYGEIGGLWFDGNWSKPDADWGLPDCEAATVQISPELDGELCLFIHQLSRLHSRRRVVVYRRDGLSPWRRSLTFYAEQ